MTMARSVLSACAALALVGVCPASAIGNTARASIPDAREDNGASFTRAPTDLAHLEIVWDGAELVVTASYYTLDSDALTLVISESAASDPNAEECASNDADSLEIIASREGAATLTMPFVEGAVQAQGTLSGLTVTYIFSNPALTNAMNRGRDPFTCASGNADGDQFYGGFDGKVLRVTSQNATGALLGALRGRYGNRFVQSSRKWTECPQVEIIPESETFAPYALCEFEFAGGGGVYVGGSTQVVLAGGVLDASSYLRARTYRKATQTCHIPQTKGGWVNGAYLTDRTLTNSESLGKGKACASLVGPAGMASDLEYPTVASAHPRLNHVVAYEHGTNRAGFQARVVFPCRVTRSGNRYSFSCRNRLGDHFTYAFTVHRR